MACQTTLEAVIQMIRLTLGISEAQTICPEQLLFYDLSFTSLDMLDLLFRLEDHFKIQIPEGTFYKLAKGKMAEKEFASEGVLTNAGRERLKALLHDSPPQIFPEHIHLKTVPRYCTVGAMARLVDRKLKESAECSS